jgi:hypothetical protein
MCHSSTTAEYYDITPIKLSNVEKVGESSFSLKINLEVPFDGINNYIESPFPRD